MKKLNARLIPIIACLSLFLTFVYTVSAEPDNETSKLNLAISFDSNVVFSRYNVKLKLDDKQIGLIKHGEDYEGIQDVLPGRHVIMFCKENNDKVNGVAEVYVDEETSFSCTIHPKRDEIEIVDLKTTSISAQGKQSDGTKPLASEEAVTKTQKKLASVSSTANNTAKKASSNETKKENQISILLYGIIGIVVLGILFGGLFLLFPYSYSDTPSSVSVLESKPGFTKSGPVAMDIIKKAEKDLGMAFASDYRKYLANYGSASFLGHELTGIGGSERQDVVSTTIRCRKLFPDIPSYLYVVEECENGVVFWQSPSKQILRSQHQQKTIPVNKDFFEFVKELK